MIPVGYMYKKVVSRPNWIQSDLVDDIYSVSGCISEDFCDYINYWKHNGFWFFNAPIIMEQIAQKVGLNTSTMYLFYYEILEEEFNENSKKWSKFKPESSFPTSVERPLNIRIEGYDVTTFSLGNRAECSPLSCNGLAEKLPVNRHCLFDSFDTAKQFLEAGRFDNSEAGPFRIIAVYRVES
jgi:hypothetical protein